MRPAALRDRFSRHRVEQNDEAIQPLCHSGAMRKHRNRNLEIPGLVLTHHPGMTVLNLALL